MEGIQDVNKSLNAPFDQIILTDDYPDHLSLEDEWVGFPMKI